MCTGHLSGHVHKQTEDIFCLMSTKRICCTVRSCAIEMQLITDLLTYMHRKCDCVTFLVELLVCRRVLNVCRNEQGRDKMGFHCKMLCLMSWYRTKLVLFTCSWRESTSRHFLTNRGLTVCTPRSVVCMHKQTMCSILRT